MADISGLLSSVADHGYAICEDFIDGDHAAALAREAAALYRAGRFRPAGIGAERAISPQVRGDEICWIDEPSTAQGGYVSQLAALAVELNQQLLLGLISIECHMARYAAGLGYARHRDRQVGDDLRTLSCTLYLNARWRAVDGGALRLFRKDAGWVDVLPRAGTMACFLSDDIEHEVLPASRTRWSLTAWLLRRPSDSRAPRGILL